jgi:hypothetical protein
MIRQVFAWVSKRTDMTLFMFCFAMFMGGCIFVAAIWPVQGEGVWRWNLTAAVAGAAAGWIIGTIFSPSSSDESAHFQVWSKGLTTFVSGYLLGNAKAIVSWLEQHDVGRPNIGGPILFSLAAFLVVASHVFTIRWLVRPRRFRVIGNSLDENGAHVTTWWDGEARNAQDAKKIASEAGMAKITGVSRTEDLDMVTPVDAAGVKGDGK